MPLTHHSRCNIKILFRDIIPIVAGNLFEAKSPDAVTISNWHHLVGTFTGANGRIYVDGIEKHSAVYSGSLPTPTTSVYLGSYITGRFTYLERGSYEIQNKTGFNL